MAWDPIENLSTAPLKPDERRDTRRVLKWFEHRVFLKASAGLWAKWLIALPTSMLAVWALVQAFLHGK
jgi:hypothetical protein